jgi:hypothetical protein
MKRVILMNIINSFLQSEINTQDLYDDIISFITSFHIRNGEFEGNEYIIKKLDSLNFIIFPEYIINNQREIPFSTSIYKKNLIKEINDYAITKNIIISNID